MSIAALTDGLPGRTLSILSATSRGRSNVKPSRARAMYLIASIADRTVSPVTSVGAPLPLPEREPECTMTRTFWATVDDPLAIVNGSFRARSIAMYSRKSIRIETGHRHATISKCQPAQRFAAFRLRRRASRDHFVLG